MLSGGVFTARPRLGFRVCLSQASLGARVLFPPGSPHLASAWHVAIPQ